MSKRQRKLLHKKRSMNRIARMLGTAAAAVPLAIAVPVIVSAQSIGTEVPSPTLSSLMTTVYANQLVAGNSFSVDLSQVYPNAGTMDFQVNVQNKAVADASVLWQSGTANLRLSLKKTGTTSIDLQVTPKGGTPYHEKFQITVASNVLLSPNNNGINLSELVKYIKSNGSKFQSTGEFRNLLKSTVSSTVTEPNHAPVANDTVPLAVNVTGTTIIDLNDFFSDDDGDLLTYQLGGMPSGGLPFSATIVSGSLLTLTATNSSSNAYDIFVTGKDSHDATATKHFSVTSTITPVNHAPVAVDPSPKDVVVNLSSTEDLSTTLNLGEYFSDQDNDMLTYSIVNVPGSGVFFSTSLTGSQLVLHGSYVSTAPYSLTVQASDGSLTTTKTFNISTVSIDPPANHAPTLIDPATKNVVVDISSTIQITKVLKMSDYFTDVDGDTLTYYIVNAPGSGSFFTASIAGGTTLELRGISVSSEPYVLSVQASDGTLTVTKNFSVTTNSIDPVNHAPAATSGTQSVSVADSKAVDLSQYFTDEDSGDTLTYELGAMPSGSLPFTANIDGSTLSLTATGVESNSYEISVIATDSHGATATKYFSVTSTYTIPNSAPTGTDATISLNEDTPSSGQLNGSDLNGDTLTYVVTKEPDHGTIEVSSSGYYTYTPDPNYYGTDTFTYKLSDGTLESGEITVTFNIADVAEPVVNHAPEATEGTEALEVADTQEFNISQYFNDEDLDDTLTYTLGALPSGSLPFTASVSGGSLVLTATGVDANAYEIYVTATDSHGETATKQFSVRSHFDNPPEARGGDTPMDINIEMRRSQQTASTNLDLNVFFTDADSDDLTYTIVNPPGSGSFLTASITGSQLTLQGSAVSSEPYILEVQAADGKKTGRGYFSVTSDYVNSAPVANPVVFEANENETYTGSLSAYDADNDTLRYVIASPPTNASSGMVTEAGDFIYTPRQGFYGTDYMTVYVSDGYNAPQLMNITINVAEKNHDLVVQHIGDVNNDVYLYKEQEATIDLSKLFTDIDGDATYTVTTTGAMLNQSFNDNRYLEISAGTKPGDWEQFNVTATDGVHTEHSTFQIVINNPTFTKDISITNANAALGEVMDLSAYFADSYPIYSAKVLNGVAELSPSDSISRTRILTSSQNSLSTISAAVDDTHGLTITSQIKAYVGLVTEGIETQYLMRDGNVSYASIPLNQIFHNATSFRITDYDPGVISSLGSYSLEEWSSDPMLDVSSFVTLTSPTTITVEGKTAEGDTAEYTITLDQEPIVNQPPYANDVLFNMDEDNTLDDYLLGSDPDGDNVTFQKATEAAHGIFTVDPNGHFTYTPNANFYGTDTMTYTLNDGTVDSAPITVTVNIANVDDEIQLNSIWDESLNETGISLHPGAEAIIDLSKIFTSVDGDPVEYRLQGEPYDAQLIGDKLYIFGTSSGLEEFTVQATDDVSDDEYAEKFWEYATIKVNGSYDTSLSDIYDPVNEVEYKDVDLDAYFCGSYTYTVEQSSGNATAELDETRTHLILNFEPNDNSTFDITASNERGLTIQREFSTYIGVAPVDIGVQTFQYMQDYHYASMNLYNIFPNADQFRVVSSSDELFTFGSFELNSWSNDNYLEVSAPFDHPLDTEQNIVVEARSSSNPDNVATYTIRLKDNSPTIIDGDSDTPIYIKKGESATLTLSDADGIDYVYLMQESPFFGAEVISQDETTATIQINGVESGESSFGISLYDKSEGSSYQSRRVVVYDDEVTFNEYGQATVDLEQILLDHGLDLANLYLIAYDSEILGSAPTLDGTTVSLTTGLTQAGDYALYLEFSNDLEAQRGEEVMLYIHVQPILV